jgi:pyruvate kinase
MDYHPFLIAKLERATALQNLEAILQNADGIMVARGDLGVEIPVEEIATVQKQLIRRANRYGKPVITATHMLESMIRNRRPTRAEATDVANAILDGTDCVMLSGETAIGDFPDEAVAVMTRIAQATERNLMISGNIERMMAKEDASVGLSLEDRTAFSVYHSARELEPAILFTPTKSGATARRLARFRLPTWIVALSSNKATCQQLHFSYGVQPLYVPEHDGAWEVYIRTWCKAQGISSGLALMTEGTSATYSGGATHIHILYL